VTPASIRGGGSLAGSTSPRRAGRAWSRCLPAVAFVLALGSASGAAPSPSAPPSTRDAILAQVRADSILVFGMVARGQGDSAVTAFGRLAGLARTTTDVPIRNRILILRCLLEYRTSQPKVALATAREVESAATAVRDTCGLIRALIMESGALSALGSPVDLEPPMRRCLTLAVAARIPAYIGHARYRLGVLAQTRGGFEEARDHFATAVAIYDSLDLPVNLSNAVNQLGNVEFETGRYADARVHYERSLELTRKSGDLSGEALALNNLGAIESRVGDLRRTAELLSEARAVHHQIGDAESELLEIRNLTRLRIHLGEIEEAQRLAESGITLATAHDMTTELAEMRVAQGEALDAAGRTSAAKRLWRTVLGTGPASAAYDASSALAAALAEADSLDAAIAVCRRGLADPGGAAADEIAEVRLDLASYLTRAGRPQASLAIARPLADSLERRDNLTLAETAWSAVVRAERQMGRYAQALGDLDRATTDWERARRRTTSLEMRSVADDATRSLMMDAIALTLVAPGSATRTARVRDAFDRMQRFKTRTLLERMGGPRSSDLPPLTLPSEWIGLGRFQHERLAAGELLLEYASDRDTTWLFAVTRDSCAVMGLPAAPRLGATLDVARSLLGAPPRGGNATEAGETAARAAGAALLGPVGDWLARARVVWIAPDGALHRVPFAALIVPGEKEPLAASRVLSRVPSATLLAVLRPATGGADGGMLALAGATGRSDALTGAEHEVRELARRYRGVEVWSGSHAGRPVVAALEGRRALHVAGHSVVNDQYPWRSGFVVGRDVKGRDSLLTAAAIAERRLEAQLVMLSSCESAGGTQHLGEGVAGLSTAFLAAGVPAVVATLWPVDDRTTAELALRFYDHLSKGARADDALQKAQLEIRAMPATAHPFYWSGFVLVGDGAVRLPLSRKGPLGF
jgi:tetratricopeptide (TPR) repeat protein